MFRKWISGPVWLLLSAVVMLTLTTLACGETASPTPEPTATIKQADTPKPVDTPRPTDTPEPTSKPALSTEELEQKWRLPLYSALVAVGSCESLLETANKLQAEEIDGTTAWGEVMAAGILLAAIDEPLGEWEPVPGQENYRAAIQEQVDTMQGVIGQWLDKEITSVDVPSLLEDTCSTAKETFEDIMLAMQGDGLSEADIGSMIDELAQALETEEPDVETTDLEVRAGRDYLTYGYLHIVGEVVNNTDGWLEYVKIVATYYDADGKMIGTDFTYTTLDEVEPHDVGVFDLSSDVGGLAAGVDSYELQVQADSTDEIPYLDLDVTVSNEYESYGYYHLVGQVENTGDLDCEYVKIVAAFYDADGNMIATDFTYTELDIVLAGGSTPFDLSVNDVSEFDHFKTWVQGSPVRD